MARDEINAFLGAGTNYHGKLHFQGAVRIDGNFQGEVVSEGTLVIGQDAVVDGQVKVGQLVLSGRIKGEVEAKNKVGLHKTANLQGNIRTPVLVVEEGAVLEGELVMGSRDTAASAKPEKNSDPS
jgi:cytoskeletal protein CcmA (bactofilin family)